MPDKTIIAFTGKKGSGKSMASSFIHAEHPTFFQSAFANTLREVCSVLFGLSISETHDRELKETVLERYPLQSPRQILQTVGCECLRSHYPDVFIEAWKRTTSTEQEIIVCDLRFQNEADAVLSMGGKIIRILRPSETSDNQKDLHSSETVQEKIHADKTVVNDGTLTLFKARVLTAFYEIQEGK